MYLPQYHCIPENDFFWGKGFTDWTTVKNAKPLFMGHQQPRVPMSGEYYDLSLEKNVVWQSKLAEKYGIYGFGVYHYWFNNEVNLLTKPAEIIRDSKDVNIKYFLAWDNASWKRSWSNVPGNDWAPQAETKDAKIGPSVLIQYELGIEKDWENHYISVRAHFLSPKYIKVENKPIFIIFNYSDDIARMCDFWSELAKKDGFDGVHFIVKSKKGIDIAERFHMFEYEPLHSGWPRLSFMRRGEVKIRKILHLKSRIFKYNYDKVWQKIIANAIRDEDERIYHGCFVQYDDTPRRGYRGSIAVGSTPDKFCRYMTKFMDVCRAHDKVFVFLTAWNEWGEGAYLEPDMQNGYRYLETIKEIAQNGCQN